MTRFALLLVFAALAVGLPLAGFHLAGPGMRAQASFEWPAFLIYALIIVAVVAPFVWRIVTAPAVPRTHTARAFPAWAWAGLALLGIAWLLAWTRFSWFAPLQPYTFTPLWLGYIITANALTYRRIGRCLLLDRPGCFLVLFPASALFWWYFEYLNRYVGNWHYSGIESISQLEYVVHASISFSTVLPAVVSTRDWLASFPRMQAGLTHFVALRFADARPTAWILLLAGILGFIAVGAWPSQFYSMVWLAPVLILTSLQVLTGQSNVLADIGRGDWRAAGFAAFAGLICGFFWELWNWYSLARWEYSIPLAHRFLVFEMPILGYAGYFPFGIACIIVAELVCGKSARADRAGT